MASSSQPPPPPTTDPDSKLTRAPAPVAVPSPRAQLHHQHHHLLDRRDPPRGNTWEQESATRRPGPEEAMDGAGVAAKPEAKLVAGEAGYVLEDVPHVSDYLPDLPTCPNPLQDNPAYSVVKQYFVNPDDTVCQEIVVHKGGPRGNHFRRAGPRQRVYFESDEVHACIVTCGGMCPGFNTVIREIVCGLSDMYGVPKILGIQGGYRGFYAHNFVTLTPKSVNDIHKWGGIFLGTSRGRHDTMTIVDSIQYHGINQVYVIGGEDTQRGAGLIFEEVKRRGLKVAVAGIPKSIENDIPVIDKSFGFDSAVEEAQRAINAAHVDAGSAKNGIALVKLVGRYSGFIAHYATLASRDVDCCLIPESPFYLEGEGGLFKYIEKRLKENGHMIIVVAEGAGKKLVAETMKEMGQDTSHVTLCRLTKDDVGRWLSRKINEHFKKNKATINLKYTDPTHRMRAIPSNASDNVYCTLLAHNVVHGAMAGYTGFTVGQVNGQHCYIPFYRITEKQNKVSITDREWERLLSSTNQPSFLSKQDVEEAKMEDERTAKLLDGSPSNSKVEDKVASFFSKRVRNGQLYALVDAEDGILINIPFSKKVASSNSNGNGVKCCLWKAHCFGWRSHAR